MRARLGLAKKKALLGCGAILIAALFVGGVFFGPTLADLYKAGFNPLRETKKKTWTPDTEANLKALYTAIKLHHESEGQFPKSSQWMEAAVKRVASATLPRKEAVKKFVDPVAGGAAGVYGFAMNDSASEKYIEDVADRATTPLLFQSTETGWNAHGDPAKIGRPGGLAVSVEGKIIELGSS